MTRLISPSVVKKIMLLIIFCGFIFALMLLLEKKQDDSFFGVKVMEAEEVDSLVAGLEEISPDSDEFKDYRLCFGHMQLPYDNILQRYYIPWKAGKSRLWDRLYISNNSDKVNSLMSLFVASDSYTQNLEEGVKADHEFSLYLVGDKTYAKTKIVFSYLPVLDISETEYSNVWFEGSVNGYDSGSEWNESRNTLSVEFEKKISLFDMNSSDKWKLSKVREDDYSYIRALLAKNTWNAINSNLNLYMEGELAELFYNGEYQGLFYAYPDVDRGNEIEGGMPELESSSLDAGEISNLDDYLTFIQFACAYDNIDDDMLLKDKNYLVPKKFDYSFGIQPGRYGYLSYNAQSRIITLSECGISEQDDVSAEVAERWREVKSKNLSEADLTNLIQKYSYDIAESGYEVRKQRYSEYYRLLTDRDAEVEDEEIDVFSDDFVQVAKDSYNDTISELNRYINQRLPYVDAYYAGLIDENGKSTDGVEYILYDADAKMPEVSENKDYKGYINIWCRYSQNQDAHKIKLYAKEGKLYAFLPSFAGDELTIEYDRSKYGVWIDGLLSESNTRLKESQEIIVAGDELLNNGSQGKYKLVVMKSANIGAAFVDTLNATMEYVDFSKERKEPGSVVFCGADGLVRGSGNFNSIRVRGHSSSVQAKKAYRLKMTNETDVYGMGQAKDWLLIANAVDASKLRNNVAFKLAKEWGLPYTSDFEWADVYFNGEYNGNYMIMEPIEDGKSRVDIDTSGDGIILEMKNRDYRLHEEDIWFTDSDGMIVTVKSPKEVSEDKLKNTEAFFKDVTSQIGDCKTKEQYLALSKQIDMESFALMYLMDEISNEIDAGYFSTYFYIDPKDGKLYAGPIWDYDKCLGNQKDRGIYPQFDCFYYCYPELLSENQYFMEEVKKLYESRVRPSVIRMIEEGIMQDQELIRASVSMDNEVRPVKSGSVVNAGSYDENVAYISGYLKDRLELVDGIIYNSSEYHKVFIENNRGRLIWVKDGDTISQELLDYICKIYDCECLVTDEGTAYKEGDIVNSEMVLYPEGVIAK